MRKKKAPGLPRLIAASIESERLSFDLASEEILHVVKTLLLLMMMVAEPESSDDFVIDRDVHAPFDSMASHDRRKLDQVLFVARWRYDVHHISHRCHVSIDKFYLISSRPSGRPVFFVMWSKAGSTMRHTALLMELLENLVQEVRCFTLEVFNLALFVETILPKLIVKRRHQGLTSSVVGVAATVAALEQVAEVVAGSCCSES